MIEVNKIRYKLKKENPLIHCITNPISINQCANAILSTGARPIMAEHPDEVKEITKTSNALLLNLGNITESRIKAIEISAKTAKEGNIPFVLDAVGVACSELRKKSAEELLEFKPSVIKGNSSEIYALTSKAYKSSGVDADSSLSKAKTVEAAIKLSKRCECTVMASGKCDIVTDGNVLIYIENGCAQLGKITGTGCMLGAMCATFLSVCRNIEAAVCACAVLGICGELAETDKGNGSFYVNLMDSLTTLTDDKFSEKERVKIEKI